MRGDRIRARMKAEGKTIREIIREQDEAVCKYAYALAEIKVNYSDLYKLVIETVEERVKSIMEKRKMRI